MKIIEVNTYKFSELSETAKQKAIEDWRSNNTEIAWPDETRKPLEKFSELFPIKVKNLSYGGRCEGVDFSFTCDDEIEEMTGQRLAKYIWNNYKSYLFKGKFYSMNKSSLTETRLRHNRVRSRQITARCRNEGRWSNTYYSAITLENSCVLTGYYMDDEILQPIYEFLNKPDANISFSDLLKECFDKWVTACNYNIEYQNSDEYILEKIENQDIDFTEEGKIYF